MKRLSPIKEIREKMIFSDDEQTQKLCEFAGDMEDILEIIDNMYKYPTYYKTSNGSTYCDDYSDSTILYSPKDNSIYIYEYSFVMSYNIEEYGKEWWVEKL